MSLSSLRVVVFLVAILSEPTWSSSSVDSFVYGGCSQQKYAPGLAYESNSNSLLTSIVNSATFSSYNNFTILGSTPQDVVYGVYQCRGDSSMPDCARCVARSVSQLGVICPDSTGAALMLQGCFVKYDNTSFLGVQDKNEVLKKCGGGAGGSFDFISGRDAVLGGLASGGGSYRVGGSGKVQGMSQCVGDLSGAQCQECVSEAIQRLRGECGSAASGDVFLGKCYARYSASGFHSKSVSDNGGEKALAITIGLLAGVALVIIFLSFLRKVFLVKGGK